MPNRFFRSGGQPLFTLSGAQTAGVATLHVFARKPFRLASAQIMAAVLARLRTSEALCNGLRSAPAFAAISASETEAVLVEIKRSALAVGTVPDLIAKVQQIGFASADEQKLLHAIAAQVQQPTAPPAAGPASSPPGVGGTVAPTGHARTQQWHSIVDFFPDVVASSRNASQ